MIEEERHTVDNAEAINLSDNEGEAVKKADDSEINVIMAGLNNLQNGLMKKQ